MSVLNWLVHYGRPGLESARRNWAPMALIQFAALVLLVLFLTVPSANAFFRAVGDAKVASGLVGAFLISGVAGGLLPEVAKWATGLRSENGNAWLQQVLVTFGVYAVLGVTADIFYRAMADAYGHDGHWLTVTKKVLTDMLVYSPFFSIPFGCVVFAWFESGYNLKRVQEKLQAGLLQEKILPSIIMCWCFWTPVLACMYSFPTPIQFPVAMLAEAAWSVLFVFVNTRA